MLLCPYSFAYENGGLVYIYAVRERLPAMAESTRPIKMAMCERDYMKSL